MKDGHGPAIRLDLRSCVSVSSAAPLPPARDRKQEEEAALTRAMVAAAIRAYEDREAGRGAR